MHPTLRHGSVYNASALWIPRHLPLLNGSPGDKHSFSALNEVSTRFRGDDLWHLDIVSHFRSQLVAIDSSIYKVCSMFAVFPESCIHHSVIYFCCYGGVQRWVAKACLIEKYAHTLACIQMHTDMCIDKWCTLCICTCVHTDTHTHICTRTHKHNTYTCACTCTYVCSLVWVCGGGSAWVAGLGSNMRL